ncbi:MAG TPA: serine/threonine protein phosphatase [Cytophagales bacterium]|nr:serine/threonine protein phosphatase [Cytophagales bacterium]
MGISNKNIVRISVVLAIISWLGLLGATLLIRFGALQHSLHTIPEFVAKALLILYIFFVFVFFNFQIGKHGSTNIGELLWKVFVTGLIATILSLATRYVLILIAGNKFASNPYFVDILYTINIALIIVYLTCTFIVWKRLILYQKSKNLIRLWRVFEISVMLSLGLTFFKLRVFDITFDLVIAYLIVLAAILSANLKWVAYLNYKQKWKNILLMLLVGLYLWYYLITIINFTSNHALIIDLGENLTILALFGFTFLYSIFSILVLLFNLPTSSVFEKKLEEVINFQRLSQSRNTGQSEEQVFEILLDSSVSAVMANAAWVEVYPHNTSNGYKIFHKLNDASLREILDKIDRKKIKKIISSDPIKNVKGSRFVVDIKHHEYKSVLVFPIFAQEEEVGIMGLLKDLSDGFNRDMIEIVRTFVNQASISIENFRLMQEAIENERYKEELKIARRVQGALLPEKLHKNDDFDIHAFSKSAAEVGGDYYDSFRMDDNRVAYVVGDVSGKGTSAAFHMAEMKGIFHSLSQLNLSPSEFLIRANTALSACLDRTSLITASIMYIHCKEKKICLSRAGHCPTLIYEAKTGKVKFIEGKGLGLAILRNNNYKNFVESMDLKYGAGNILMLYTDGIIEAKNKDGLEFGYDRLKRFMEDNHQLSPEQLNNQLLDMVHQFAEKQILDDDYTTLIIKFK